jgi:hypothetical protein
LFEWEHAKNGKQRQGIDAGTTEALKCAADYPAIERSQTMFVDIRGEILSLQLTQTLSSCTTTGKCNKNKHCSEEGWLDSKNATEAGPNNEKPWT